MLGVESCHFLLTRRARLPLSAVTLTGPVIGRGPLFSTCIFRRLCLVVPRGSAPQWEPWGPQIADDKIAAAFHGAQGYTTLFLTAKPHLARDEVCVGCV